MTRNPLSSRKTKWAPRRAAFFSMWPILPLPLLDGFLVALSGSALGLLATPSHATEQLPNVRRVVAHPEVPTNLLGDSRQRPQLVLVAGGNSSPQQQPRKGLLLLPRQARRRPRRWPWPQALLPRAPVGLHPAHQRAYRRLQNPGHLVVSAPGVQHLDGLQPPSLQTFGRSAGSHAPSGCLYPLFTQASI